MTMLDSPPGYFTIFRHIRYRMPPGRFSKLIIINLFVLFVVITFLAYYNLPKNDDPVAEIHQKGVQMEDLDSIKAIDLKSRIEEMIRIKISVSNELRDLESRRQKLQSDISILTQRMEDLKVDYLRQQVDLDRLRISVEQAQYAQKEVQDKNTPFIGAPKRILPSLDDNVYMSPSTLKGIRSCKTFLCFDYSRCSLSSGFPVYFYQPEDFGTWNSKDHFLRSAVMEALNVNIHITFDPTIACVFVVLIGEIVHGKKDPKSLEHYLNSLNYWNGNGRNHILFNLVSETNETSNVFAGVNTGRAIIVQSHFTTKDFRNNFDIIAPPLFYKKDKISKLYLYSPARRKFLLSYQGEYRTSSYILKNNFRKLSTATLSEESNGVENAKVTDTQSEDVENLIVNTLKEMQLSALGDNFFFQFSCAGSSSPGYDSEWLMCGTHETRLEVLQDSTFSLLVSPSDYNLISTPQIHVRLIEALKTGAVPVVLGDHVHLPFDEVVDWRRAAVILPKARVTELHYYLRTIGDSDIIAMRHQGRLLWEHYLAGPRQVVSTILSILRNRIQIPAPACREESSPSVFNETFRPLRTEIAAIQDPDPEENLGPVESPFPSLSFRRNLTIANSKTYFVWNDQFDPFILYPHTPFDPVLPSESKFIGSSFGFRPIGQGAGGSGKEFSEALGGNYPREQFTIVILTYEREAVLIDSLQRLRGLPYLNKVVVVWNSEKLPSSDLRWPEIGVPIHVIKAKKNSLNNRFLPFDVIETEAVLSVDDDAHLRHDEIVFGFSLNNKFLLFDGIETEAVLSVDDDAHLRHDEIVFGFRVWREARDRIVGFPGRYHAWYSLNGGWHYNSNYSCELSMVLTGAAFFHKYYTYLYSYSMPQVIRDKVDEYMNCEDIAMNFLVSHVTRKPPIKVTSRWTFRCPGCPVSLSEEDSHFQERHKCIDFFSQVYGYMPLLNTQFRADSVLFKTRIPHDKQKCFKFI